MAVHRIRVRNKDTGEIALVAEKAFGHFAAHFERLDQPDAQPGEQAPAPASALQPDQPKPSARRTAANDKE